MIKDSKPRLRVLPSPLTKIHQIKYFAAKSDQSEVPIFAVSTEDGRIIFYSIHPEPTATEPKDNDSDIPGATAIAQIGGKTVDLTTRIKDFEILLQTSLGKKLDDFLIVTGSSDGTVRLWMLTLDSLIHPDNRPTKKHNSGAPEDQDRTHAIPQVGTLLGSYETGNRITCLKAFIMLPPVVNEDQEAVTESEASFGGFSETSSSDDEDEEEEEDEEEDDGADAGADEDVVGEGNKRVNGQT